MVQAESNLCVPHQVYKEVYIVQAREGSDNFDKETEITTRVRISGLTSRSDRVKDEALHDPFPRFIDGENSLAFPFDWGTSTEKSAVLHMIAVLFSSFLLTLWTSLVPRKESVTSRNHPIFSSGDTLDNRYHELDHDQPSRDA